MTRFTVEEIRSMADDLLERQDSSSVRASDMLDSYADLLARTTWQPIETAPKDGTTILLSGGQRVSQGGWLSEVDQGADYEGQGLISAYWWSVDGLEPTHWMPLPPAEETQG